MKYRPVMHNDASMANSLPSSESMISVVGFTEPCVRGASAARRRHDKVVVADRLEDLLA